MPKVVSRYSLVLLTVVALAYLLPVAFDTVFPRQSTNPLLLYSPVLSQFIYQESLGNHQFRYQDEAGQTYSRSAFEQQLPFLYYRNLELKGLLPSSIGGQTFDAETIKAERHAITIHSRRLRGHFPLLDLYPLFNNDPQIAIMPFPEDVFRFTNQAMEFINADHNRIDRELTESFTTALRAVNFVFPATLIGGNPTNLKPYDDGYFIRDRSGHVFHVRRVLNQPEVIKTPIDPDLDILDIIVSEHHRRELHGTIITTAGEVYLISREAYHLTPLPIPAYDPGSMDFKLLIDPLHRTVTISNDLAVHGVVMDTAYRPLRTFTVLNTDLTPAPVLLLREFLLPFEITLASPYRGQAAPHLVPGGPWSLAGLFAALGLSFILRQRLPRRSSHWSDLAIIAVTGFYGLVAVYLLDET